MNIFVRDTSGMGKPENDKWHKVRLVRIYRDSNCSSGTMIEIAPIPKKKKPVFFPWDDDGLARLDSSYMMDTHFVGDHFCVGKSCKDRLASP